MAMDHTIELPKFFLNQLVVFYQRIILTRFMSAKYPMFEPEKLNLPFFCQLKPAPLVVILCIVRCNADQLPNRNRFGYS